MGDKLKFCLLLTGLFQIANARYVDNEPITGSAMTTVLARPLGGYGLSPLIFEPTVNFLSLSSDPIETKVRKSPVYELIMPNFDDEPHVQTYSASSRSSSAEKSSAESTLAEPVPSPAPTTKLYKKLDYESMVSKVNTDKSLASQSSNSYYSSNNMIDMFNKRGSKGYGQESMPSYNEQPFKGSNYNSYSQSAGPVRAAIQSIRSVEVKDVQDSYENAEPQIIDIAPSALPIIINFRTSSSQIQIHQSHEGSEPVEVQQTQSEDEPQYLKHQVTKPVIQEVHEIIMPYRKIIQEIRPVEEEIKTVVARGKPRDGGQQSYQSNGGKHHQNNSHKNLSNYNNLSGALSLGGSSGGYRAASSNLKKSTSKAPSSKSAVSASSATTTSENKYKS